tara:strand:+ start:39 stop:503 length:465 start_codon:yes stop_codon:yes gene_type:complete
MGFDPVTAILIASAVSVGTSIQQGRLAKKQAKVEQASYQNRIDLANKEAEISVKNAHIDWEFAEGRNISLASRMGINFYHSGSALANRAYNQTVLNDTLNQVEMRRDAKTKSLSLSSEIAGLKGRYAMWGAAGDIANTTASSSMKLYQLDKEII